MNYERGHQGGHGDSHGHGGQHNVDHLVSVSKGHYEDFEAR